MRWCGAGRSLIDPAVLRESVRLEDVISYVLDQPLFRVSGGSELLCRCWIHSPDDHPSTRINTAKQVYFCDVCGKGGDVFTFIRERHRLSMVDAVRWLSSHRAQFRPAQIVRASVRKGSVRPRARRASARGARVVYPYFDADWSLLFQKIRTPDKRFYYRRPNPGGGWLWGLGDVVPVLYRLPMLQVAPFVLIVEGEKDVDAAWGRTLPATTNPEGAGKGKWKSRYTSQLLASRIRQVYVIPDNDDVGRIHAREVLTNCREGGLYASLVSLPEMPEHGDLSDFFALGHTRRDLLRLIKTAGRHGGDQ